MKSPIVRVKKLNEKAELPKYQTPGAAGCDVCACLDEALVLRPGERTLVSTGLSLEIPLGFEVQVRPRSGLAFKNGISVVNSPGTIDSDYRGEVKIILINLGQSDFKIQNGDRIAQFILAPVVQADFTLADDLSATDRGAGGFGSTGVQSAGI